VDAQSFWHFQQIFDGDKTSIRSENVPYSHSRALSLICAHCHSQRQHSQATIRPAKHGVSPRLKATQKPGGPVGDCKQVDLSHSQVCAGVARMRAKRPHGSRCCNTCMHEVSAVMRESGQREAGNIRANAVVRVEGERSACDDGTWY